MAVIIDNDAIKFLKEFRPICSKYVESSTVLQMTFKDGSTIGMRTLLEVGLGVKEIKDVI